MKEITFRAPNPDGKTEVFLESKRAINRMWLDRQQIIKLYAALIKQQAITIIETNYRE